MGAILLIPEKVFEEGRSSTQFSSSLVVIASAIRTRCLSVVHAVT